MYRLNTFPFIHLNVFHAAVNILALTPLLERFESEYGTLTSVALFFGREFALVSPLGKNGKREGKGLTRCRYYSLDDTAGVHLRGRGKVGG